MSLSWTKLNRDSFNFAAVKLKYAGLFILLTAICISFVYISDHRNKEKHKLPAIKDLEGNVFKKSLLKGKVSIVSYFQTWCSDCAKEQPELLKLLELFGKDSLEVLMISDEPMDKIVAFKDKFSSGLKFYHCDQALKRDLGIRAFPTTYLLDKKQNVSMRKIEGIHWYTPEVITEIRRLLKE